MTETERILYKHYGVSKSTFSAEELLLRSIGTNAESHMRGVAGEIAFQQVASNYCDVVKVPDKDKTRRYDFTASLPNYVMPITVEAKLADDKGSFDVQFRDRRYVTCGSEIVDTYNRTIYEKFDYVAVNMVNKTGSWSDICYVRHDSLPKIGRITKKYAKYAPETQEVIKKTLLAGSFRIDKLPHFRTFDEVIKDFTTNGQIMQAA